MTELPALPTQPQGMRWPTQGWPEAAPTARVNRAAIEKGLERMFAQPTPEASGETHAVLVVHRGQIAFERYSGECGSDVPMCSWSMAKSITHALVGILVREGALDPQAPAQVPAWPAGDPRASISLEHLLRMCDGLDFAEDYVDEQISHVIDMLFGEGKADVADYATARPAAHRPGSVWSYSSGTTNIVTGILGRAVGGGEEGMRAFMQRELFAKLGMRSADPRFDDAGTFIGSSFVFATARDFARFGLLYLRDGVWDGERILPAGWVDHARRATQASLGEYGAHWWLAQDGSGIFSANGYRGQYIVLDPSRDLIIVRLGGSTPEQRPAVVHFLADLTRAFPRLDT